MSSIIKSPFISFSDQKKTIEVISSNDTKIINPDSEMSQQPIYPFDSEEDDADDLVEGDFENDSEDDQRHEAQSYRSKEIIAEAMKKAEQIIAQANETALAIENEAQEKGYDEGYKAGKKQALKIEQKQKQKLKEEIEATIQERMNLGIAIQPKIAEIIQTLVRNMIGIQKFEPSVILFLIKKGLDEAELTGDIIIKVSDEDYDEVIKNKAYLTENMSDKLILEILKDNKLHKNDCIIETSLGNVDCSLGERMEGLFRQLQLIEKSFYTD